MPCIEEVVLEKQIFPLFSKHFEAVERSRAHMRDADFSHESIHLFRESIRRLRALLFFYMPLLHHVDYLNADSISKMMFNMTSLIREIDVFERSYKPYMKPGTTETIHMLKAPLKAKLREDIAATMGFSFAMVNLHFRPCDDWSQFPETRQLELYEAFIQNDADAYANEEKYIHNKRMVAKKLAYIHKIVLSDVAAFSEAEAALGSFQDHAKQLHDVCVNLRLVGQYHLDDEPLITKLISDHRGYQQTAEQEYKRVSDILSQYLQRGRDAL